MTTTQTQTVTVNGATAPPAIDLSSIGAKPKASGRSKYPVHPDPTGDVAALVPLIKSEDEQFESLKGTLELHKAELTALAMPFYFETNSGRIDIPSSIACYSGDQSKRVLVTFTSKFKETTDAGGIAAAMGGADKSASFTRQSFVIKIDGDQIPAGSAQACVNELVAICAKHGASGAITAKSIIKPTPEFILQRHTLFTPEQNQKIQMALPMVTQVKAKAGK